MSGLTTKSTPKCICCNSDNVLCEGNIPPAIVFAGRLLDSPMSGGELFHCRECNVAFRYPQHDSKILNELYRQGKTDHWQPLHGKRQDWQIASKWIRRYLKTKNSSILDVGCFDGSFLNSLDYPFNRFGIEIHEEASIKAQECGVQIIGKNFTNLTDITTKFDVVTSFDVIEHSQNPFDFLRNLATLTKDGGIIIISTGNYDSVSWRLLGSRYWYCTIGEHLSFISPQWCEWGGNQLGLELKQIVKFSHANSTNKQRINELIKNLLYAVSPYLFACLRRAGMGGDEYRCSKDMLEHPPSWMSAKDHVICVYCKHV